MQHVWPHRGIGYRGHSVALTDEQKIELLSRCDCAACPIAAKGLRRPILPASLEQKQLAFVVEYPGPEQKFLSGMPAKVVAATIAQAGMNPSEMHVTAPVLCWPGKNPKTGKIDNPNRAMLDACGERLRYELAQVQPVVTLGAGASASKSLMETKKNLPDIQGVMHQSATFNTWVLPTYHPKQVLMDADFFPTMKDDVQRAVKFATGKLPLPSEQHEYPYAYHPVQQQKSLYTDAIYDLRDLRAATYGTVLAIDVETDGLSVHTDDLLQVAISNGNQSWVFDAEVLKDVRCYESFRTLLRNPDFLWIMHNMRFDLQWFRKHFDIGIHDWNTVDTMCLGMGVTETGHSVSLKSLSRKYFSAPYYEEALQPYLSNLRDGEVIKYSRVPGNVLAKYAAFDVIYTQRLHSVLSAECKREGTYEVSRGLLQHAQRLFADMEYDGVAINTEYVEQLRAAFLPKIRDKNLEIKQYARLKGWEQFDGGRDPLNPRSRPRLAEFLFDVMKYHPPVSKKVKEALRAGKNPPRHTGAEFYEQYPVEPITRLLQEFAQMTKLMDTYVNGIVDDLDVDGRVHPDFLLQAAVTGRISMKRPPLQTIPSEDTSQGFSSIKKLFVARPRPESGDDPNEKWVFIGADYAQLELRIAWHLSNDPNMADLIMSGDFHRATAAQVFGIPESQVTSVQRKSMKYVSFGIMYGRTEYGLFAGELGKLGNTLEECRAYRNAWLARFPVFAAANERFIADAAAQGFLQSTFGRKRRWGLRTQENEQHINNQAINFPGQSTASDLCLHAAIRINKKLRERGWGRGLFIVHDSIECEVREQFLDDSLRLIYQEMITPPFETTAIFDVEIEHGPNWGTLTTWHPEQSFIADVRAQIATSHPQMAIDDSKRLSHVRG